MISHALHKCQKAMLLLMGGQDTICISSCGVKLVPGCHKPSSVLPLCIIIRENLISPPDCSGVRVARSLVFCVVFFRSLFVFFVLSIVLSVLLRFTASSYAFGIFRLFLFKRILNQSNEFSMQIIINKMLKILVLYLWWNQFFVMLSIHCYIFPLFRPMQ